MLSPVPHRNVLTKLHELTKAFMLDKVWVDWLVDVKAASDAAAQKKGAVDLTAQGAAIATTAVPTPTLTAGLYRITWYARITRAATTSSSLTPTVTWTDGGVSCSQSGAAMVGNTTATVQTGTLLVRIDTDTTIRYETAFASVGATSMQYALYVRVEVVP